MSSFLHLTAEGESRLDYSLSDGKLTVADQTYDCDGHSVWVGGRRAPFWTHQQGDKVSVWLDGEVFIFTRKDPRQRSGDSGSGADASGSVKAQMPGKILSLAVQPGDAVSKGQNLLIMESMKMELALDAPLSGTVTSVEVAPGQLVSQGQVLVLISAE